jgi:dihydrofolate reductase
MSTIPKLSAVVARAQNGVIGRDGDLPWRLPSDLKFFKATTMGKPVLMGRKTWESLPFPLPGRPNLILTRDETYRAKKGEVFHDLNSMVGRGYELAGALNVEEVVVIGGAQLYRTLMPYIDRLYVTQVLADIEGDAWFDAPDSDVWALSDRKTGLKTLKDEYDFVIEVWDRI